VQGARRLANFGAVAPVLEHFGFRVVAMEALTLDDQIRTMQRARYVIGEHGAGVANIMFCHPGARVLELFNPSCPQPAHWVLASLFDLGYGYVVGRHVPTSYRPDPDWNADYAIEPAEMTDAIRALLAYGGG
jgi:capsular polysaccharide biosynthesis protein